MTVDQLPPVMFVTGTDTGIGKTVISAMLTLGLQGTYWKPIQSGLEEETDTEFVKRLTGFGPARILDERFRLTEPLSPHASAAIDGVGINMNDFRLPEFMTRHLVIEGAGGLMVPMNEKDMIIDLIAYLKVPALLVVRSELGTLNHTFLSLEALRKRGIPIMGVIMNGPENESNKKAIQNYGKVEVIGEVGPMGNMNRRVLTSTFNRIFNT